MAKGGVEILGLRRVMNNLNKEASKIKVKGMKGLIESSVLIRRDMDKTSPKIPVDTGNLRGSYFTTKIPGLNPSLIMGFNANYAIYVHEMVDDNEKKINWNREGSGSKFFEKSIERNRETTLLIMKKNMEVK